jgi:hypothetical protein
VRLVEYTARDGTKHLAWLRDGDLDEDAAQFGVPHDPPDLGPMGLGKKQERELHNALVERRLVAWQNSGEFKRKLAEAGGGDQDLTRRLALLYRDAWRTQQPAQFVDNLETLIDALPYTDAQRVCIKRTFAQAGLRCLADVENAPTRVGHLCKLDIYQIVAHLLGKPL